jgi:diacylglycerol O-acyltransferase / wax synthase
MSDRLSALDGSFLYLEQPGTVMHVGSVAVFAAPPQGFDEDQLMALVGARIAYLPRYRQRVRMVPGRLANPVWVDDENFDLGYHLRRAALPRPGSANQLAELVARLQSRPLDRRRPLWEVYLVEGLADGQFAMVTKAHQALVDGVHAVDIAQVILDDSQDMPDLPDDTWVPAAEPSDVELVVGAISDALRSPQQTLESLRGGLGDVVTTARRVVDQGRGLARIAARTATKPAPTGPLLASSGEQRRFAMVASTLADHREVRRRHARRGHTEVNVNDVVLAVVTGALRSWLLSRSEPVPVAAIVRALVPVSVGATVPAQVAARGQQRSQVGGEITAFMVDLPIGEPNPTIRLHQIAFAMRAQAGPGRAVRAQTLANIAGFAPPTLHLVGARVASAASRRLTNLTITNVPGPQHPMYAAGAQLVAAYPVMPLAPGQAVSIGLTSYDGGMYYGINADLAAMPDIEVLAHSVTESLAELLADGR